MNTLDNNTLVKTAVAAVLAGAKVAEAASALNVVNHKGSLRDIVTQADLDISTLLAGHLQATGIPVVCEEQTAAHQPTPPTYWAVDPIDGTVNFSHGLAQYGVCVGLVEHGHFLLGAVCAPALDELYFTLNPQRALLNGRPLVHVHKALSETLAAASFGARGSANQYALFQAVNESTQGCLRTGSAALNICWAASGRLQLAYGFGARVWDVAAALAVARGAGCAIALRHGPNPTTLDYCVGSQASVDHLIALATSHQLWSGA
ncbi:MAG: hypothetical protein IPH37_03925 [Burkholderiales bacterium]|nr:hypothetical protein [Burkholderiales bacterium]